MDEIRNIFDPSKNNYHVQMVNSDEQMNTILDEETGELTLDTAATIFIGGNILDRGVTIQNMLCFFYGRDPKKFQQDTVLQHARMYGSRSKEDMAVMRFHTTAHIYKILARMNNLDEQLRQWFIEGNDQEEPNAVFVGYDDNIKPCASQKIKVSNALTLKQQQRILPVGFWTGTKTAISKTVEKIDKLIEQSANYNNQDTNGFFEMDKSRVIEILKLIESTYEYDEKYYNSDRKNDIKELLCAIEYCTAKSNNKIYALHRTNRNMTRIRENGCFIDAPDDGHTDTKPSRDKAQDVPVIMFLRQNGAKSVDPATGDNNGWNNAPFYWPVLMTQQNITPVMYALDQRKKGKVAVVDISDILEGIDPKDVLSLTYKGDLEEFFGPEGAEYGDFDRPEEKRGIKKTTAGRYILKDEKGNLILNPDVPFDKKNDHGVYSYNKGKFPFMLIPYKYMLLRNRRDAKSDIILMELTEPDKWRVFPATDLNEDGDLLDAFSEKGDVLVHGSDIILNKKMGAKEFVDKTICQWIIVYSVKKILKFKKNTVDWEKVFGEDDGDN